MFKLVPLRQGESTWNLENRWTDVDLSPRGIQEAHEAARLLREGGFSFDVAYGLRAGAVTGIPFPFPGGAQLPGAVSGGPIG